MEEETMPFTRKSDRYLYPLFNRYSLKFLAKASGYAWDTLYTLRSRSTYQGLVAGKNFKARMVAALQVDEATLFGTGEKE